MSKDLSDYADTGGYLAWQRYNAGTVLFGEFGYDPQVKPKLHNGNYIKRYDGFDLKIGLTPGDLERARCVDTGIVNGPPNPTASNNLLADLPVDDALRGWVEPELAYIDGIPTA